MEIPLIVEGTCSEEFLTISEGEWWAWGRKHQFVFEPWLWTQSISLTLSLFLLKVERIIFDPQGYDGYEGK